MTPKEKAKELVEKYKPFVYCYLGSGMLMNWEDKDVILSNSKICALIAVDEMIDYLISNKITGTLMTFWQEVKQEINKL